MSDKCVNFKYFPGNGGCEVCDVAQALVIEIPCESAQDARMKAILHGGCRDWADAVQPLLNRQPNVSDQDLLGYGLAVAGKNSGPVVQEDGTWVFENGVHWLPGKSVIKVWNTVYGTSRATPLGVEVEMNGTEDHILDLGKMTTRAHRQAYANMFNDVKAYLTRVGEEARTAMKRGLTPAAFRALKR